MMAAMSTGSILRFLVFASVFTAFAAREAMGEKDCYDERDSVMRICRQSIKKHLPPTARCRHEVGTVDMPCICRVLTVPDERVASAEKLVRCAGDSGVHLPIGSKCGSYTIVSPPPPSAQA